MPPKGAPPPRAMVHVGAGAPTARPQSGAGAWPCGCGRAEGADTKAAPEHPPRVCEVLNSFDGKTEWGCQLVPYHVLQRYDLVVDARDVADDYEWACVQSQGRTGWAPRAYLKNLPPVPAKVSLAQDCSLCAPLVNVVRLPLPELKCTAPLAVCVCDSQSDIMSKSKELFLHFSGERRIAEQYAHPVTSNDVMHCQFASFGGPWADPRYWYIVGSIERPGRPTSWAVGVGYNKKQYYCLALHFAMALTLAQEIPDDDLLKFGCGFRELVLQVTK